MTNPFDINRDFEAAIGDYTGAPFVVTTNSCTMALFLALRWHYIRASKYYRAEWPWVSIPKRTYVSVPMQAQACGYRVRFDDRNWEGWYSLNPLKVYDSARWFTSGLFGKIAGSNPSAFVCVSFHATKTLGLKRPIDAVNWDIEQGGAILHNDPEADKWLRRARFDGRTEGVAPKDDIFDMLGHHCYLSPSSARLGLKLLKELPRHNPPLPNDDYPDLSLAPIFRS